MGNPEPIRGKVAKILNSRDLVINRGSQDGVRLGMVFNVLDAKAEDIRDPETEEILGSLRRPKVQVKVTELQDRLARASTFQAKRVNIGGAGFGGALSDVARMFEPPKYVTRYETLKTDEATWSDIDEEESFVKTGDPVEQVAIAIEPEYQEETAEAQ